MPSCTVSIDACTSVVPVIGESVWRRIKCRGSYGLGKIPPMKLVSARYRRTYSYVLSSRSSCTAMLLSFTFDQATRLSVKRLILLFSPCTFHRSLSTQGYCLYAVNSVRIPAAPQMRPIEPLGRWPSGPPPNWSVQPTAWPCTYGTTRKTLPMLSGMSSS